MGMERLDCLQPSGLPLGPFGLGPVDRLPVRGRHQPCPGVAQLDAARIPGKATRIRIAPSSRATTPGYTRDMGSDEVLAFPFDVGELRASDQITARRPVLSPIAGLSRIAVSPAHKKILKFCSIDSGC